MNRSRLIGRERPRWSLAAEEVHHHEASPRHPRQARLHRWGPTICEAGGRAPPV